MFTRVICCPLTSLKNCSFWNLCVSFSFQSWRQILRFKKLEPTNILHFCLKNDWNESIHYQNGWQLIFWLTNRSSCGILSERCPGKKQSAWFVGCCWPSSLPVLWWLQVCAKLKTKPSPPNLLHLRRWDTVPRFITPTVPRVPSAAAQVSYTHRWRWDRSPHAPCCSQLSSCLSCVVLNTNKISDTCLNKSSASWTDRCIFKTKGMTSRVHHHHHEWST